MEILFGSDEKETDDISFSSDKAVVFGSDEQKETVGVGDKILSTLSGLEKGATKGLEAGAGGMLNMIADLHPSKVKQRALRLSADKIQNTISDIVPEASLPEDALVEDKLLYEEFPRALGQAGSSVGLRVAAGPIVSTASLLGQGYTSQSADAKLHGADEATQQAAGRSGAGVEGITETVGVEAIVRNLKVKGAAGVAVGIAAGGVTNAVQEAAAGVLNNYVAAYDLEYDIDRDVWRDVKNDAEMGGAVGLTLSALFAAAGLKGRVKVKPSEEPTADPFESGGLEGELLSGMDETLALEHLEREGFTFENDLPRIGGPAAITFGSDSQATTGDSDVLTGSNTLPAPIASPPLLDVTTPPQINATPHISTISPTILLGADNIIPPQPEPDFLLLEAEAAEIARQQSLVDIEAGVEIVEDALPGLTIKETQMYNRIGDKIAAGEEVSDSMMNRFEAFEDTIQGSPETALLKRFATDEENTQLANDAAEGTVNERRQSDFGVTIANSLPRSMVDTIVKKFEAQNPGASTHVYFESMEEIPEAFQTEENLNSLGFFVPRHMLDSGTVVEGVTYINAGKVQSEEALIRTLLHENVTHHGLRGLMQKPGEPNSEVEKRMSALLQALYARPEVAQAVAEFNESGVRASTYDLNTPAGLEEATEEFIAHVSESGGFKGRLRNVWNQLVKFFMEGIRKMPFVRGTKFAKTLKRAEVDALLRKGYMQVLQKPKNPTSVNNRVNTAVQATDIVQAMVDANNANSVFTESELRKFLNKSEATPQIRAAVEATLNLAQFKQTSKIDLNSFLEALYERTGGEVGFYDKLQQTVKEGYLSGRKSLEVSMVGMNPQMLQALYPQAVQSPQGISIPLTADRARVIQSRTQPGIDASVSPMRAVGMSEKEAAAQSYQLDRFNTLYKYVGNLMQMTNANQHIAGVLDYWVATNQMTTYAREWAGKADETLQLIRKLPKEQTDSLFKFMMDQTFTFRKHGQWSIPVDGLEESLVPEADVTAKTIKHYKLEEETLEVYQRLVGDYQAVMDELELLGVEGIQRDYAERPEEMEVKLAELRARMRGYKRQPYAPAIRFGKYTYRATYKEDVLDAKGKVKNVKGSTVEYGAMDNKKAREERIHELKKAGYQVTSSVDTSQEAQNLGMLNNDFFSLMKDHLELDGQQLKDLQALMDEYNPTQGMAKYLRKKSGVKGWSEDGPRAYATYMQTVAYALSKIKYRPMLIGAKGKIQDSLSNLYGAEDQKLGQIRGGEFDIDTSQRARIAEWYGKHYQYITSNQSESSIASTTAFVSYIWAAPKAVLVNFTQIPLQTIPYLGSRYSYAKSGKAVLKAAASLRDIIHKADGAVTDNITRQAVAAAHRAGIFNETLMRELGNAANGYDVARTQMHTGFSRGFQEVMWWGAAPFQFSEKINRFVTFVAAFELEYNRLKAEGRIDDQGVVTAIPSDEHFRLVRTLQEMPDHMLKEAEWEKHPAYIAAKRAVENTQFVFARQNRPLIMRNPVGRMAGVFQTPFLGIAYNILGGDKKAWVGMLAALTVLTGYEGLPFATTAMNLADVAVTKIAEKTGYEGLELPVNIRQELRQDIESITGQSDLLATGLLGPHGLLNLSSSVSMGDPFRIGESTRKTALLTPNRKDPEILTSVLGNFVVPSMLNDYTNSVTSLGTNSGDGAVSDLFSITPGIKHPWKYYKRIEAGGVYTRGGLQIVEFSEEGSNPYGGQWLASSLGFPPDELTLAYEEYKKQSDSAMYWAARREDLRSRALQTHTESQEASVDLSIRTFNKQLPKGAGAMRLPKTKLLKLSILEKQIKADVGLDVPKFSSDRFK